MENQESYRYILPKAAKLTKKNIMKFLKDYQNGKIERYLKSQRVPTDQENEVPVKTIVGKNFDKIVMDNTKDVLVKYYAPW